MLKIPDAYAHEGRTYVLIKRNALAAIYKCSDGEVGYEIHRVRVAQEGYELGKRLPKREILASIREWGEFGWSYLLSDYKGALKRFKSITGKRRD
jgi:hypothetical protein